MIYAKATLVGLVAALAAAIIWIGIAFVLPIVVPLLLSRFTGGGGVGAAGAVVTSGSILTAALVGFVLGFWKTVRRSSRSTLN